MCIMQKTPRRCGICGEWTTGTNNRRPAYCSRGCMLAGIAETEPELLRRLREQVRRETQQRLNRGLSK